MLCYNLEVQRKGCGKASQPKGYLLAYMKQIKEEDNKPRTKLEELVEVILDERIVERKMSMGALLAKSEKERLVKFLNNKQDVFAWSHKYMPKIDSNYTCHKLNIDLDYPTVEQKPRCFSPENSKAINDDVDRLLEIGVIEEYKYPNWVSNPVVVKKNNRNERVCIDFTNLNKVCPKDGFLLPKIDQIVGATIGYQRMSFLDAYFGYNKIPMKKEDRIHMHSS